MVIVDERGKIVLIKFTNRKVFGYSRQELLNQPANPHSRNGFVQAPRLARQLLPAPRARAMGEGRELFGLRRTVMKFLSKSALSTLQTDEGILVSSSIRDITERNTTVRKSVSLSKNFWKDLGRATNQASRSFAEPNLGVAES